MDFQKHNFLPFCYFLLKHHSLKSHWRYTVWPNGPFFLWWQLRPRTTFFWPRCLRPSKYPKNGSRKRKFLTIFWAKNLTGPSLSEIRDKGTIPRVAWLHWGAKGLSQQVAKGHQPSTGAHELDLCRVKIGFVLSENWICAEWKLDLCRM